MLGLDNPIHILLVLVVVLMVFGAKRLPELGRGLGSGMRGFKESINGEAPDEPQVALSSAPAEPAAAEMHQPAEARPTT
jgi:sec-independent protein translocase protein TatA